MILNWGKRDVALTLAGSTTTPPTYMMIGSGSGTPLAAQTELINAYDRQLFTSIDDTTTYKVKWTGDWNTVEMSGTQLREFGMIISGTGLTGSMWSRECLASAITFDGTNELRIEETWEVF